MRAAIYWAPEPDDPLWRAGNAWLGRDPESGASPTQPDVPGIAALTAEPRRYGFHATLQPPTRLRRGWFPFLEAAEAMAGSVAPFALPPLEPVSLRGFCALCLTEPCPPLQALADASARAADPHRVPPDAEELARRGAGRSAAERAMLARWGYPHMFELWTFHMTLSHRLADPAPLLDAARAHFAEALAVPRRVASVSVYTEREPGAPLLLAARLRLGGDSARDTPAAGSVL